MILMMMMMTMTLKMTDSDDDDGGGGVDCDIKCNKFTSHFLVSKNVCHVTKHME